MRPHSVSKRRPRISKNHTTRLSMVKLCRRKRIPRIMTPASHIRHTRRLLTITKHVTRQPVTLVRDRPRMKQTRIRHANKPINSTNTSRHDRTLHKKIEQTQTDNETQTPDRQPQVSHTGAPHPATLIEVRTTKAHASLSATNHTGTNHAPRSPPFHRTPSAARHPRQTRTKPKQQGKQAQTNGGAPPQERHPALSSYYSVPLRGFEPRPFGLRVRCSDQLSYRGGRPLDLLDPRGTPHEEASHVIPFRPS